MGFFFILLANIFNVYAPVIVGDGIDFLAEGIKASQEIKNTGGEVTLKAPQSFYFLLSIFQTAPNDVVVNASNLSHQLIRIGLLLALAYFLFYILKGIFLFYQRQTIIVMSRYIEYDLKNEIYDHYQKLDAGFYKRNRTGDLMNRISEDVSRVRMYLGPAVMYTINLIILVVMCILVMWRIDAELTLYTLSPLPFMMLLIFYVSTMINKRTEQVQEQQSKLSSIVQESISGIRVLKAFRREKYFDQAFQAESDDYKTKQLSLVKADALFMPVIALLVGLSTILTIYVGANKVIAGELSYGVIVQFVFYVNQLTWPFASVGWVTSLVQKAEASQQRINEFLNTNSAIDNPNHEPLSLKGKIVFKNVSFTYPDTGIEALHNISFTLEPGKKLAIVGKTGSGKSTIAQLLLRTFDVTSGQILLDEKDIRQVNLEELRRKTGYVPQEVFLFSDTIENNIAFGVDEPEEQRIHAAAADAAVHENIVKFPQQYKTLLGERGINLSGGQKQRVSIARAFIKNPEIFIFDDCLSAVDTETEEHILQSLEREMKGKTGIIISHRISSIKNADHIIVMEKGRLVEEGDHSTLLSKKGLYAFMYEQQQRDQGAQLEP